MTKPGAKDYPLAETRPEMVRGHRGKALSELSLEAVLTGEVTMEDLRITPGALQDQASIARDVGRETLARNFERAGELVHVPQDVIMETYEMLRPGRVQSKSGLLDRAALFREVYNAPDIAAFIEEAAEVYERRRLFSRRF